MQFKNYYILDKLSKKHFKQQDLSQFYIISVQHLLSSTGSMFEVLINYGFIPNQIFLTGKIYSTHFETKEKLKLLGINVIETTQNEKLGYYIPSLEQDIKTMWKKLEQNLKPNSQIIILDDGGYTLKNVPQHILNQYKVYGIEQTTSGIKMQHIFGQFPVIHVATSANKLLIEPKIVSEAIQIQLGEIIRNISPKSIGVIGYGHIGKAVVKEFKDIYKIVVFDIKNEMTTEVFKKVEYCSDIDILLKNVDILIGATGQDISSTSWLQKIKRDITLISVSSGDVEFNKFIKNVTPYLINPIRSPLDVLKVKTYSGHTITVLRGGMVANFTGKADSSPGKIIQVTRGLLFAAIIQIIENTTLFNYINGAIMLSPFLQKEVTEYWFYDQPQRKSDYPMNVLKGFQNINWIRNKSGGKYIC